MPRKKRKDKGKKRLNLKALPPLPIERLKICPGGFSNCPLCTIGILEDLKYLNALRFEKKWTYKQIREYIKATFQISPNYTKIADHYLKHVTAELRLQKFDRQKGHQKVKETPISKAIDTIPKVKRSITNADMETAYTSLTQLAKDFTQKVQKIYSVLKLDDEKLQDLLKDVDPLTGMERVAKLSKEARELLKDLSSLRAPKVVVAHFLEQAIDQIIYETGFVLSDVSKNAQEDLFEALRTNKTISTEIFKKVFADAARDYTERMINLRREQLSKATSTLADLEKLI